MKRKIACIAALCMALSGCSWMDGSYVSVTPYREHGNQYQVESYSASNEAELRGVLEELVEAGTESAVINVADFDQDKVESHVAAAVQYVCEIFPVGAFAVDTVNYEIGTGGGKPAVAVNISYVYGRSVLRQIQSVPDMTAAEEGVAQALEGCDEGLVLLVENYEPVDMVQWVADFAEQNPQSVMETPQVAVGVYPDQGQTRVVELKFTYQNSRDSLRQMQSQVQPVFASAALYVSGEGVDYQKYAQLYAFLMERFDYTIETSITPSYSLLRHGVGDCKAFATVYAAMCHQAGLECMVITGTRAGEPWTWNMIYDGGAESYYHVDLLYSNAAGSYLQLTDVEMGGYVWDYSAYPAAEGVQPETPAPTESDVREIEGNQQ